MEDDQILPITPEDQQAVDNGTTTKVPSFTGELILEFPLTAEEKAADGSASGFETFVPQALLRSSDKWSYPYPSLALSEDATMNDFVNHFGEDFVADIFLDGLRKFCQQKWRQSAIDENNLEENIKRFKEIFFLVRRDTGPTAAKTGLEITKLMKELGKLKQGTPERRELVVRIKELKLEQDRLMEKEMEL